MTTRSRMVLFFISLLQIWLSHSLGGVNRLFSGLFPATLLHLPLFTPNVLNASWFTWEDIFRRRGWLGSERQIRTTKGPIPCVEARYVWYQGCTARLTVSWCIDIKYNTSYTLHRHLSFVVKIDWNPSNAFHFSGSKRTRNHTDFTISIRFPLSSSQKWHHYPHSGL